MPDIQKCSTESTTRGSKNVEKKKKQEGYTDDENETVKELTDCCILDNF